LLLLSGFSIGYDALRPICSCANFLEHLAHPVLKLRAKQRQIRNGVLVVLRKGSKPIEWLAMG
jgi:hypothetical protein